MGAIGACFAVGLQVHHGLAQLTHYLELEKFCFVGKVKACECNNGKTNITPIKIIDGVEDVEERVDHFRGAPELSKV